MKTYLKTTKQFRAVSLLLGVCMLLAFGCKQVNSPFDTTSENEQTIEGLNINVKYAESYDQTEITYSRIWPKGISAGLQKGASSGGELLVDYERTKEVIAFDEEGYMSTVREYLEGDGEMNMPESAYNNLKDQMPARSADHDPVVRIEFANGIEKMIGRSGKVLYEDSYDQEQFRIDLSLIDSLYNNQGDETQESIRRNILRLENSGVSFNLIDERFALYSQKPEADLSKSGIVQMRYLDDLQTGENIRLELFNKEGMHEKIFFNQYRNINGIPVLFNEEIYSFGKINGRWGITERTVTSKSNINIIKN